MLPSPNAWQRHTRTAATRGLSAGALACLGTQPRVTPDPSSFTGWMGTVICLNRTDAIAAGQLAASAIGSNRGIHAQHTGATYTLHVPISAKAARELTPNRRTCNTDHAAASGMNSAAYRAIMRPSARARQWANEILKESNP